MALLGLPPPDLIIAVLDKNYTFSEGFPLDRFAQLETIPSGHPDPRLLS